MKPLPDTASWLPKSDKRVTLRDSELQTCRSIEARIQAEAQIEKRFNINNFDAGPGIEDIVRQQLRILLPTRYDVCPAVIVDGNGDHCGECDVTIANRIWSTFLKHGATSESRRVHIPVEAVYTIIEVKQTLTEASLDEAMEKIVMYKRLHRSTNEYGQIVENYRLPLLDKPNAALNYRFDFILAVSCESGTVQPLVQRFFEINETLERAQRVNSLAILGHGHAHYLSEARDKSTKYHFYPESDMEHLHGRETVRLIPTWMSSDKDTLYHLFRHLRAHLTLTILDTKYGKIGYGHDERETGTYYEVPLESYNTQPNAQS